MLLCMYNHFLYMMSGFRYIFFVIFLFLYKFLVLFLSKQKSLIKQMIKSPRNKKWKEYNRNSSSSKEEKRRPFSNKFLINYNKQIHNSCLSSQLPIASITYTDKHSSRDHLNLLTIDVRTFFYPNIQQTNKKSIY